MRTFIWVIQAIFFLIAFPTAFLIGALAYLLLSPLFLPSSPLSPLASAGRALYRWSGIASLGLVPLGIYLLFVASRRMLQGLRKGQRVHPSHPTLASPAKHRPEIQREIRILQSRPKMRGQGRPEGTPGKTSTESGWSRRSSGRSSAPAPFLPSWESRPAIPPNFPRKGTKVALAGRKKGIRELNSGYAPLE